MVMNEISINNELKVEVEWRRNRTVISIYENGVKKTLSDMRTWETFHSRVAYNDYYIVAYSYGCMAKPIPATIDAAYSITEKKMLELTGKLEAQLYKMFAAKKTFTLSQVLQAINNEDLQLIEKKESEKFVRYLTCGNPNITKQEITDYILKCYPELEDYTNIKAPISVLKFEKIKNKIESTNYSFHIMPQDLLKLSDVNA